ncbi:MAG: hypothetical protein HYZ54_10395 [Ignavibacteriae bacterium]|nr:hypothetical protein [Ignavibacteriota bacterium]
MEVIYTTRLKFIKQSLLLVSLLLLSTHTVLSQNSKDTSSVAAKDASQSDLKLNVTSDVMSRYIWRGTDYGDSPSIEPTISLSLPNLEIGFWGSIATNSNYKEIDLYLKYTYKTITGIFTDYCIPYANGGAFASPNIKYFNYNDKTTCHVFEGSLLFKGGDNFPLWLQGNIFFYGNDKRWGYDPEKDVVSKTYYSSYFEVGYSFPIQGNTADVFIGFSPIAGYYGNTLGVVNLGITGNRKIKISQDFELPVKASLIFNPQSSICYFVFGMTF